MLVSSARFINRTIAVLILTFTANISFADLYCTEPKAASLSHTFASRKVADSWVSDSVTLTDTHVEYWGRRWENLSNSQNKWSFAVESRIIKFSYKPSKTRLQVNLGSAHGIKQHAPFFYHNCVDSGQSRSRTGTNTADPAQVAFQSLSLCKRKYIQSFLKSGGLYSSSIDGLWGQGTRSAVSKANKKVARLNKNNSQQIIRKLASEAPC